jgi:hypothetical protein
MLQLACAARLAPQLLVVPKLAEVVIPPMINALLGVAGSDALLVSVTVCAALVVPTAWEMANVTLAGERLAMGAVTPTPFSAITCGLLPALSVKVTVPTALPAAVGVKVTLMVQIPPAVSDAPQVLVCAKEAVATIEVRVRVAVPVLVTVTICAALVEFTICEPKLSVLAESVTAGALSPVPPKVIVCGLLAALSAMVTLPYRFPAAVGVNVTLIVQFAPAASVAGHVFVWPKSPEAAITTISSGALPVLVKVTDWAVLVVPTF